MKVLIVSDTHGREDNLEKVLEKESPIDAMVHLGYRAKQTRYAAITVNVNEFLYR